MSEYRTLRAKHSILEMCKTPELAAQVTLQPINRFPLDAAIIFAPVGSLVPKALEDVDKGGMVICGGIHMSNIPAFSYSTLWQERMVRSVANLTRKDGEAFLKLAAAAKIKTEIKLFQLHEANEALQQLRNGKFTGAAVLIMPDRPTGFS